MQKFPKKWDLKTKIEFLQRKILFNSIAYYVFDYNFITDMEYDALSKQLVELHKGYGDVSDTMYGYCMRDFDGSTGFDLYYRLTDRDREYLSNIVKYAIIRKGKRK